MAALSKPKRLINQQHVTRTKGSLHVCNREQYLNTICCL